MSSTHKTAARPTQNIFPIVQLSFAKMMGKSMTLIVLAILLFSSVLAAADECAPSTWAEGSITRRQTIANASFPQSPQPKNSSNSTAIQPGQINCRYYSKTKSSVNSSTCFNTATRYRITVATFFTLNPSLDLDCSNIQPNTRYCVAGCELEKNPMMLFKVDFEQLLSPKELRMVFAAPRTTTLRVSGQVSPAAMLGIGSVGIQSEFKTSERSLRTNKAVQCRLRAWHLL